ncbi:MAG: RNA pyrophosphohydrolase [Rhodospirillaceae bacterium]|nr:RNA pyrophosphohydrolase [Alphaproteobacteria bacterium]MBR71623.1 RNA pyrophosphohydrolase [Rhodospirillaceae bacterium]
MNLYRQGVGIVLINTNKQVFTGRRMDMLKDVWQMPQGGINDKEDRLSAAYRELEEETSIKPHMISIIAQTKDLLSYDFPENLSKNVMGGKFSGQQQRWYLCMFLGSESDINVNTKDPEFDSWCWMDPEELIVQIVDFKKSVYKMVFKEFSEKLNK